MNVSKRYFLIVLSALCGCTPIVRLTNLTPQAPIPEDSVRIVQTVESGDSARKIADFRIRPIRMRGTARRAERDIIRPLRRTAARNGAELAVIRTTSTKRFLWGCSHTAAGTLLTLRNCDAPRYAADSILPRHYSERERKRTEWQQEHLSKIQKRRENLRADRRAPKHAFTLAAGYLHGFNALEAAGIPWHRNRHRSWSLEAAYTFTDYSKASFGARYLYSCDSDSAVDAIDCFYAGPFQTRIFPTGGRSDLHYIAPELGLAQRFAKKRLLLRERTGMGAWIADIRQYRQAGVGLHLNLELEYRLCRRIGLRIGATFCGTLKACYLYEDDYSIRTVSEVDSFRNIAFAGTNYTFGLNIDL